jgi:hypothetical protein
MRLIGSPSWRVLFRLIAPILLITSAALEAQTTLDRRQPRLMTEYKWASLTERQQGIYIRGFLETVSFFLYSQAQPGNEQHAQAFSDWTLCAERQPVSRWRTLGWCLGELDKTAAAQFFDLAPTACQDSANKGDKKMRPVWLLKPTEWKSFSSHDRAIYLMAYVETFFAGSERANDTANVRKLDICIAKAGIEGLISSMDQTKIEWQYPLPWSVSRALGATCKAQEAAGTPEAQKADRRTREYKATSARVLNNSAMMHERADYFVTHIRSAVGNEGIPDQITLGDTVTVKGKSIRVRHIFVTETLEDLKWGGKVLAKKGEVRCMIVEAEENLPHVDETRRNKRWIHIAQCEAKQ